MKIISVVGARPNFMKIAPLHRALRNYNIQNSRSGIQHLICHTGQHYDNKMSEIFFNELDIPKPDFYLGVGSDSHAVQTAKIMIGFEKVLLDENPDLVIVVGDVNSTIACSLVAAKIGIKIAHIEAGLRSFDLKMPEEINRILTDRISDYLFVTEKSGIENLKKEGVPVDKVFFVGNIMIDNLVNCLPKTEKNGILKVLNTKANSYILVTMHRPSNVDSKNSLIEIINMLNRLSNKCKVIFPVHPRTKGNMQKWRIFDIYKDKINFIDPVGYIDFLTLTKNANLIITDSGGIQEESTFLGVQCITVRDSTERPVTVYEGTNQLIGTDFSKVEKAAINILDGNIKTGRIPELWDGKASERITKILFKYLN